MSGEVITIKVHGLEEIDRALAELPNRIANKVLRKGVSAGGMLLKAEIKKVTPTRQVAGAMNTNKKESRMPGFLKKNIGARYRRKVSRFGDVHYGVGPVGQAFYGYFVEAGHAIGKRKRYGRGIAATNASRPMVPAHPFMIPTFERMQSGIIERMKEGLTKGIVKEGGDLGFIAKEDSVRL